MKRALFALLRRAMLGVISYAIGCLVIGWLLVWLRMLFSKISHIGDSPVAFRLIGSWVVVFALPYLWVEGFTLWRGEDFKAAAEFVREKGLVEGDEAYMKVFYAWPSRAKILLVSSVQDTWGGTYRNLYFLRLMKDEDGWYVSNVEPVNTREGDSAGFTIPPYW